MAFGRLGLLSTTASTNATVYTAPTNCSYAEVSVDILNNDITDAVLQIALALTGTPTADEYIEDGAIVPANGGILMRSTLVLSPGENIVINSSLTGTKVRVSGKEMLR